MLGTFNTEVVTTLLIDAEASDNVCWLNAKRPPIKATFTSYLSCLRLLGVLGERNPSLGHFDEKGLMLRSAGCLRQPNALNSVVA
jgi:hypothetical protein